MSNVVWISDRGYGEGCYSAGWACTHCGKPNEVSDEVAEPFLRSDPQDFILVCRYCRRKFHNVQVDPGNGGKIR